MTTRKGHNKTSNHNSQHYTFSGNKEKKTPFFAPLNIRIHDTEKKQPFNINHATPTGSIIQTWPLDEHQKLTREYAENILKNFPGFKMDEKSLSKLAEHATDMDRKIEEIGFNLIGFLIGQSDKDEKSKRNDLISHYKKNINSAMNHGEGGLYEKSRETATKINIAQQNMYAEKAKATFKAIPKNFKSYDECKRSKNSALERILTYLGDAFHIAQDRGAHGEGAAGEGHSKQIFNPKYNPDSPKSNEKGYQEAKNNTELLALDVSDILFKILEQAYNSKCFYTRPNEVREIATKEKDLQTKTCPYCNLISPNVLARQLDSSLNKSLPLPTFPRTSLENTFGANVRAIRPPETGKALQAQAFSHSRDVFFNRRQYQLKTTEGKQHMEYESPNVVQQNEKTKNVIRKHDKSSEQFPKEGFIDYKVQWGETLIKIGEKFKTSVSSILKWNPEISDPEKIIAGQTIRLNKEFITIPVTPPEKYPAKDFTFYKVQWGDTLIKIGEKFGVPVSRILEWNPEITNTEKIIAGRSIRINIMESVRGVTRKAFWDFVLGNASSFRFDSAHPWTIRMKEHPHMKKVRLSVLAKLKSYCSNPSGQLVGTSHFNLNDLSFGETVVWLGKDVVSWLTGGKSGQESAFIYGSFRLYWSATNIQCNQNNASAKILFQAKDLLHLKSALRIPLTEIGPADEPFGKGEPFNNIPLEWNWDETIGGTL